MCSVLAVYVVVDLALDVLLVTWLYRTGRLRPWLTPLVEAAWARRWPTW